MSSPSDSPTPGPTPGLPSDLPRDPSIGPEHRPGDVPPASVLDPAPGSCVHCGLSLPADLVRDTAGNHFCCHGCRTVFEVLHGAGLESFYRLRGDEEGAVPKVSGRSFEEFDDAAFHELYVRPVVPGADADGPRVVELYLEGVHCSACIWLVEKLPGLVDGVLDARLDFGRSVLEVEWDPSRVPLSAVARRLDGLGYAPHPARGGRAREQRRKEERAEVLRLGVAAMLAMNAMLIAFALYGGILDEDMSEDMTFFLRYYSLGLATVSLLWPGRTFLRGAWASLRTRTPHMDLPIAIGLVAGVLGGAYNTWTLYGEVYFESVAFLIFLLLFGRYVQSRQQRSARDSLELLHSMTPARARRLDPDTPDDPDAVREVPVAALDPGDLVELRAGDSVPADGELVEGASSFDLSLLTGESRPVSLAAGATVHAGTVNLASRVVLRIEAVGEATRLGALLEMVEKAAGRATPLVRFADRLSGRFTVALLLLALATLLFWWPRDPAFAVENAVALLIVACPCALGLATPLAIVAGVGRAARVGIMVQGGEVLERLAEPGVVYLDKTGTLTRGEVELVRVESDGDGPEPWIAALESQSSHPLAVAIGRGLRGRATVAASAVGTDARTDADRPGAPSSASVPGADAVALTDVREVLGRGLEARLEATGEELRVGSPAFLEEAERTPAQAAALEALLADGLTPVLAARAGRLVAVLGLGDPLRPEAADMVRDLAGRGWRVGILSGDHPRVVDAVGRELGLDPALVRGGVSPEDKLAAVEAALEAGRRGAGPTAEQAPVVMVGDGVNDAAALARASTGVAVHGGAEVSLSAADVYLAEPGLGAVVRLLDGSRRVLRIIRRGLGVSLLYNGTAATLAVTGYINPILAAILMPFSSLTVVSLAYRSRTFTR